MKLALGTAQFGLDYGINNPSGKVPAEEVRAIVKLAAASGIDTLDTAQAYGTSEGTLAEALLAEKLKFKIVSKFQYSGIGVRNALDKTLKTFGLGKIYGFMFHRFADYAANPGLLDELNAAKKSGLVEKTGFSVYYPREIELLTERNAEFDLVQFPYNVFDRRFEPYFKKLNGRGVEIHARSVFLQGLVYRETGAIQGNLKKMIPKLDALRDIARGENITVRGLCLAFVCSNKFINKAVIGVDSASQLKENLADTRQQQSVAALSTKLRLLEENDERLVLPMHWERA